MPIFAVFPGHEATVAAVAAYMRDYNLTPADVLAAYDEWLAARKRTMIPTGAPSVASGRAGESAAFVGSARKAGVVGRSRAGDSVQLPNACPVCGAAVELYQLCHISSPVWRTQLACMADRCAWHGKSKMPIDVLLAAGAGQLQKYVMEG